VVLLLAGAAGAQAGVPAVEVSTWSPPCVARDIDESSRIYVAGPVGVDGTPSGQILLPPHPGGEELVLECNVDPFYSCFHEYDVAGGFAESGRILGWRVWYGSGGPFVPGPATWSATGSAGSPLQGLDGGTTAYGRVAHGNSSNVFVGVVPGGAVYWSGPYAVPIAFADPASPERINDAGEIVGNASDSAVILKPPSYAREFLGELPGGATSRAHDLDSSGLVVGSSDDGSGDVAVVWTPNGPGYDVTPLPLPVGFEGGSCTEATAISDDGRIAGNCTTAGGQTRGVIWQKQEASWAFDVELDPLAGDTESAVFGLNESGQAVGRSGDEATAAPCSGTLPPRLRPCRRSRPSRWGCWHSGCSGPAAGGSAAGRCACPEVGVPTGSYRP